ncbi:MAG: ABC transporter ATP-binding protein [Clostridia bacterium]|nr:ABC transporter ATP-binding protein [Clostridia bacterium]
MAGKGFLSAKQKLKHIFNAKAFAAILDWSKPIRGDLAVICLIACVSSGLSLAVTMVTKGLIDGATSTNYDALIRFSVLLALLMITERGLGTLAGYLRTRSSARLQKEMQSRVTASILGKDYAAIKPFHSGQLVNRVFSDVAVVKNGILGIAPSLLRTFVSFVGAAIILISMDWRFVPVLIIAGVAGALLMLAFRMPMKRRHKRMQAAEDALHASTQETLENIRVVKASASEERALEKMDGDREQLRSEQMRNGRLSLLMNNGLGSMFDISWLVCNIWGCVKIYRHEFTYGSLAAMIQLIGRIQAPIANAVNLISQVYGVVASTERLMDVTELPDDDQGAVLERFDRIVLRDVSFQYDDGISDVLLDVNCEIARGDFVALTGISGGGKTSLFQLLLGIYKPTSGSVLFVDGEESYRANRGCRGLFAYVPQGNTLFSGTLRDNLTRFSQGADDAAILKAAKTACIEELVNEIGLDAVLGERGIGLSEGQAQRVAIARALLSGAPILLLDEATSALDEQTEAMLLKNISNMREKTCIIVTHRRAALSICDYQLRIENGRMARLGTEDRLQNL